jgi:8-oxo-dGTP diphosphatase
MYKPTRRYPPAPLLGVGVVVLNDAGQVLLIKRGKPPRQGQWSIPGGMIDVGEYTIDAAHREVREECAIEVEIGGFLLLYEFIERDTAGQVEYHYVLADYWARHIAGLATAQDDAAEVAWVDIAQLDEYNLPTATYQVALAAHKAWQ